MKVIGFLSRGLIKKIGISPFRIASLIITVCNRWTVTLRMIRNKIFIQVKRY
jgi:hypothetical protein